MKGLIGESKILFRVLLQGSWGFSEVSVEDPVAFWRGWEAAVLFF